ncbi:MAG: AbrB/MazE/SpoVT family DNA-binding domain-containing protein [Halobacteriota archaeon]
MEVVEEIVKIGEKGQIILPEKIREKEGLKIGDLIMINYVDGFIILSKVEKKMDVLDVFAGLGDALREKGYDSEEKITELIDEVKEEVTEEWIRRVRK